MSKSKSSGERVAAQGNGPVAFDELVMSLEMSPVINPGGEVTLGIDLQLGFDPRSDTAAQRFRTTLRVAQRDLIAFSTGTAEAKDGKRHEHLVFLQPSLINGSHGLEVVPGVNDRLAPKAHPVGPRVGEFSGAKGFRNWKRTFTVRFFLSNEMICILPCRSSR